MYAADRARASLERQYPAGHPALFPDLAEGWRALVERTERLAGLGEEHGLIGHPRQLRRSRGGVAAEPAGTAPRTLASDLAIDLADRARYGALGLMGETEMAATTAARCLRPPS